MDVVDGLDEIETLIDVGEFFYFGDDASEVSERVLGIFVRFVDIRIEPNQCDVLHQHYLSCSLLMISHSRVRSVIKFRHVELKFVRSSLELSTVGFLELERKIDSIKKYE